MKVAIAKYDKPLLIRETSRLTYRTAYRYPYMMYQNYLQSTKQQESKMFKDIILNQALKSELHTVAYSLINKKKNMAPFRNFLFYGPPGTGKTLFAKLLAFNSNMDYAIMTGADISPLGPNVVSELNKVFDWANQSSSRGMLLFVDEADAFLRKRD